MDEVEYLRSFISVNNPVLEQIEKESAGRDDIQPFVEPETGRFLSFLVKLMRAEAVLELGTGIGNSAIWMGQALSETGGRLYTVDNHPRTKKEAVKNITDAGLLGTVTYIEGNAEEIVEKMIDEGKMQFDIIFQDCGKYLYPELHEKLAELVKPGGVIVADDTLFHASTRVRKNLGTYTDRFNHLIFSDPRFYSAIIPVGHGLTLALRVK